MFRPRILITALAATALLGLAACSDDKDEPKRECTTSEDCAEGFVCSPAGRCVEEEPTEGCDPACGGDTPYCLEESNTCVECTEAAHCGQGETCNTSTWTCETEATGCESSDDCEDPTPVCSEEGVCVTCTATEGCDGLVCDTSIPGGACVECVSGDQCDTGVCSGNRCVTCTETEGCDEGVCDTSVAGGACVECLTGGDCTTDLPFCVDKRCVECTEAAHCGERETCVDNVCVPDLSCASDDDCEDPTPRCDLESGACVACLSNVDCGGTTPVCNDENVCVACSSHDQCGDLVCMPNGACGERAAATSLQIAAVLALNDGTLTQSMPIEYATVTFLKPAMGSEGAGFFVQAEAEGPAIFVEVASLDPAPAPGDVVSFGVLRMGTVNNSVRRVEAIESWQVHSSGADVSALVQDVSDVDLVAELGDYEAELIRATGTLSGGWSSAGANHQGANFHTAGVTSGSNLKVRFHPALIDLFGLVDTCSFTVTGPLWKFGATAQILGYEAAQLTDLDCPAPSVVGASATSATEVQITFDRAISASSVASDGSQFAIEGLAVTGASVSGKTVILTTAPQVPGFAYTITFGAGVLDVAGGEIEAGTTVGFTGFMVPAKLLINEINPGLSNDLDLVEVLVIEGGSTAGVVLEAYGAASLPAIQARFPDLVVATGDIFVVHLGKLSDHLTGEFGTETTAKDQYDRAEFFANAWDVVGESNSRLATSGQVLLLTSPTAGIIDAVPFLNPSMSMGGNFYAKLAEIVASGHWLPADGCGEFTPPELPTCDSTEAAAIGVNWSGLNAGTSVQRIVGQNTKTKADWTGATAATWGEPNG